MRIAYPNTIIVSIVTEHGSFKASPGCEEIAECLEDKQELHLPFITAVRSYLTSESSVNLAGGEDFPVQQSSTSLRSQLSRRLVCCHDLVPAPVCHCVPQYACRAPLNPLQSPWSIIASENWACVSNHKCCTRHRRIAGPGYRDPSITQHLPESAAGRCWSLRNHPGWKSAGGQAKQHCWLPGIPFPSVRKDSAEAMLRWTEWCSPCCQPCCSQAISNKFLSMSEQPHLAELAWLFRCRRYLSQLLPDFTKDSCMLLPSRAMACVT
ncbi:uncharacterized protein LOC113998093 [Pipra filicauda]|uniref:Uncharacterized protein LOC113998093 n=1 Tax=Pipra filicauda TaxID=649802 RepID=A0A7R5KTC5_9PASS|nr:uncharacterized protein LOC113998093 [Pipra filicauda]